MSNLNEVGIIEYMLHQLDLPALVQITPMYNGDTSKIVLDSLYVRKDKRHQGYGKMAVLTTLFIGDYYNCDVELEMSTKYGTPIKKLKQFYKKFGFYGGSKILTHKFTYSPFKFNGNLELKPSNNTYAFSDAMQNELDILLNVANAYQKNVTPFDINNGIIEYGGFLDIMNDSSNYSFLI